MKSKKTILLGLLVVLAIGAALVTFLNRPAEPAEVSSSPTPTTADRFAQDRAILGGLSKEFGAKFFTYQRPNDPAYFDSIRPYMTPEFFAENKRLTDRETVALSHSAPIRSSVNTAEVVGITDERAEVRIEITTEEGGRIRNQTVLLNWLKRDNRWSVNSVQIGRTAGGGGS